MDLVRNQLGNDLVREDIDSVAGTLLQLTDDEVEQMGSVYPLAVE